VIDKAAHGAGFVPWRRAAGTPPPGPARSGLPGTVWANLRSALLIGGGLLLVAAFLARRWWTRRRRTG